MTIDYPWYMVLLCLLAGAVYAGVLYFVGRRRFSRGVSWLLAALRFVVVSAIAFLLLAPMTRRTVHERQQPYVAMLADVSQSVTGSADSAFSLAPLARKLEGHCRVIPFGDNASTDIGAALDLCSQDEPAAIVLATDGIYNRGANPVSVAAHLAIPVYTIALGDTTPRRDAALANLRVGRVAMMGGTIPLELTVQASLLAGLSATFSISDDHGRQLHSQRLTYADDDYILAIQVQLPATEAGLHRFTAHLTVLDDEVIAENNTLSFYVDIIDSRRRVAIVANAPHPDLAALKRSIEVNPNYEAEIFFAADMRQFKADDYSMAILHNMPSREHPDVSFAAELPQMYVIGLQTDLARFNALHTGLEIIAKTQKANEVTAIHRPAFSLFTLDDGDAQAFEQLPPLPAPFGEGRVSEGVQTLFAARLGSIDTRQPIIAATAQGEPRRIFVWGEGLWRWRLADYAANGSHDHFDHLAQQLVAFGAMHADRQRLRIESERTYPAGQPVVLRAQLYNEAYELVNTADVDLSISTTGTESGTSSSKFTFRRDGDGYSLTLPDLKEGIYRYRATSGALVAEGSFAVEELGLEQRRLVADHGMLRTLAQATGGTMYTPDDIDELRDKLLELKPVIYSHTRYTDFLGLPLVLALLVLLLAAEWIIRKWHGEI